MFNKYFNQPQTSLSFSKNRQVKTESANDRWLAETVELPILIQAEDISSKIASKPLAEFYIDVHSQSIPGLQLLTNPPCQVTSLMLLAKAISVKENGRWKNMGLPAIVQRDLSRGGVQRSLATAYEQLGIECCFETYSPGIQGSTDRFIRKLCTQCLQKLPGYIDSTEQAHGGAQCDLQILLTRDELEKEIEGWIVDNYHQRPHPKTGRKPADLWEESVHIRMLEILDRIIISSVNPETELRS